MPDPTWATAEESLLNFRERTPLLSAEKMIAEVREALGENAETLLDALNAIWGHGFSAEDSGSVEAPCGHFFRVAQWIVTTDSAGFMSVEAFDSLGEAMKEFQSRAEEYAAWDDDD